MFRSTGHNEASIHTKGKIRKNTGKENSALVGHAISSGLAIGKASIYEDILRRDHELYEIEEREVEDEYGRMEVTIEGVIVLPIG